MLRAACSADRHVRSACLGGTHSMINSRVVRHTFHQTLLRMAMETKVIRYECWILQMEHKLHDTVHQYLSTQLTVNTGIKREETSNTENRKKRLLGANGFTRKLHRGETKYVQNGYQRLDAAAAVRWINRRSRPRVHVHSGDNALCGQGSREQCREGTKISQRVHLHTGRYDTSVTRFTNS